MREGHVSPSGLRWQKLADGRTWGASSGELMVAMVGCRPCASADGAGEEWWYSVDAVHTKWISKGRGETKSERTAVAAVERCWAAWLEQAGLIRKVQISDVTGIRAAAVKICTDRAAYFDRTHGPGHWDRADTARSYRATADEIASVHVPEAQR